MVALQVIRILAEEVSKRIVPKGRVEIRVVDRDQRTRHVRHVGKVVAETRVRCQGQLEQQTSLFDVSDSPVDIAIGPDPPEDTEGLILGQGVKKPVQLFVG